MRLIVDENVPESVAVFLETRGHEVLRVRDHFGRMTPDEFIAWAGDEFEAVVVTLDRDFKALAARAPAGGRQRFRRLGYISLRCKEPRAPERIGEFIEEIEREHARAQSRRDRRLIVEITESSYRIVR
ncbi:MAG: DUF5615 family PIN-like protein [Dehalococcoidia bacterium]|nr:DUF5615 family PIN-like protein [Dehalococcoidia bacterium]